MLKFNNHNDIVGALADVDAKRYRNTIDAVNEVAEELKKEGFSDEWIMFLGQCRICNYEENIICPAYNDLDNQECGNCGNKTMQEKEIPEWEQP